MTRFRNSIYVLVAGCSVAMAACQPAESPADRVSNDIHQAARALATHASTADPAAAPVVEAHN